MFCLFSALYTWASLCKSLPGEATPDPNLREDEPPTMLSWSSCLTDYKFLTKERKDCVSLVYQILEQKASVIEPINPITAPVLCCLAVGGAGNEQAASVYAQMMEYAQLRGVYMCV